LVACSIGSFSRYLLQGGSMKVLAIVFMVAAALIFSWLLTGCGEAQSWAADQASLADAIHQAAKGGLE
jgi:uncharacterized lipoprotein YehR (DUF1307 family)